MELTKNQRQIVDRIRAGEKLTWHHNESCPRWRGLTGMHRVYYPTILPLLDAGVVEFVDDPKHELLPKRAVLHEDKLSRSDRP